MPATSHVCPKCTYEHPCFFSEGDIVSLTDDLVNEPAPWTGIVLDVERDPSGRVYRVLWGPPPPHASMGTGVAAKHSGQHRRDELTRFLVPLVMAQREIGGGGGKDRISHEAAPIP